jgi:hypothetical protein
VQWACGHCGQPPPQQSTRPTPTDINAGVTGCPAQCTVYDGRALPRSCSPGVLGARQRDAPLNPGDLHACRAQGASTGRTSTTALVFFSINASLSFTIDRGGRAGCLTLSRQPPHPLHCWAADIGHMAGFSTGSTRTVAAWSVPRASSQTLRCTRGLTPRPATRRATCVCAAEPLLDVRGLRYQPAGGCTPSTHGRGRGWREDSQLTGGC